MGSIYSFADFFDMLRRRAGVIVFVTLVGCLVSVFVALQKEQVYMSAEVIQITQPKIANELARSTVDGSSARRLQLIEQRLMARGTILEVADQLGLFADQPDLRPSQIVNMVRHSVSINGTAAAREGYADDGTISVLTITARMPTAALAQAVAQEFSRRTIELSSRSRIDQARITFEFFTEKEQKLKQQFSSLEEEISTYRKDNGVTQASALRVRSDEIAAINASLLELSSQRIVIEQSRAEAQATQSESYAARLKQETQVQLDTLEAQEAALLQRRNALEASLEPAPEVERQLGIYQRSVEQLRVELDAITTRRSEAEVGLRLEMEKQAERLTVLESAPLPDYALGGSRKSLAMMGGVASVLFAMVFAFILDLRNPVLRSSAQMKRETGLAPLITVPDMRVRRRGFFLRN